MPDNLKEGSDPSGENAPVEAKFIDPRAVIKQLDMEEGIAVADFGCGTGYFSLPIAQKIGKEGRVYSLDILPEKLEAIESQAKTQSLTNIITKRVNLENKDGSRLGAESVDWIIMKDVLFQNKEKSSMLEEAKRILKPGGKILLIEWKTEDTPIGPDKKLRIPREKAMELINESQMGILKEVTVGDFHYGFILVK